MPISARALTFAVHEHDFAMIAKNHGCLSRNAIAAAIQNLPDPEYREAVIVMERLINIAAERTAAALNDMGIVLDMKHHPMIARSSYKTPISQAEADKQP